MLAMLRSSVTSSMTTFTFTFLVPLDWEPRLSLMQASSTPHPWLVSLYLDCPPNLVFNDIEIKCPTPEEVTSFTESIRRGHIVWHAGPMNMQIEFMNEAVLEVGLHISRKLDEQFSYTSTVLSQRDVPGLTAADIPTFVKNGIKAVSVGFNPASAPPAVPKIFNWNDQIIGIWHPGGYPNNPGSSLSQPGGISYKDCAVAPGTGHALCFAFRTDNTGPPTSLEELNNAYQILREEFPGAKVFASTIDEFVANVNPSVLPKVNGEIGDTWIQGIAADSRKSAEYRALARSLLQYMSEYKTTMDDPVIYNTSRYLIKLPEHTWGLPGISDHTNWSNAMFKSARLGTTYIANENSHPLHDIMVKNLEHLKPAPPDLSGYFEVKAGQQFKILNNSASISFDPTTGSVNYLSMNSTSSASSSMVYADSIHPIGLFTYHTYNETDFFYLKSQYGNPGNPGYDKPGSDLADPVSQTWPASLVSLYQSMTNPAMFAAKLTVADLDAHTLYGAPEEVWVTTEVTADGVDFDLVLVNKTATRLPEATMFSFYPVPPSGQKQNNGWECSAIKVATGVLAPESSIDMKMVVMNGSQYQHAVEYVTLHSPQESGETITLSSPDVPLVCPILLGDNGWTPTPFPAPLKPLTDTTLIGMAFNIHNNIWNTNYPLYYPFIDEDSNFKAKFSMQIK